MATLYIVPTPIGNLEDITLRALRVLKEVSLIAAEDTRVTRKLLSHFEISVPLATYTDAYQRKKASRLQTVLDALDAGGDVALVSDAGTPGLSDPGYELTGAVLGAGHQIVALPGPSAITTALVASGLPSDRFTFAGFLPRKKAARRAFLAGLAGEAGALVVFESPHRLAAALDDALEALGERPVAVARELSKRFEEIWRGQLSDAARHFAQNPARGEITLVIGGASQTGPADGWPRSQVDQAITLLRSENLAPAAVGPRRRPAVWLAQG